MSAVVQRLASWTLDAEPELAARIGRLIHPYALADLLDDEANAEAVVGAWTATREHRFVQDSLAWGLLFALLRDAFAVERADLSEALRARRMNFPRTRLEIHLQGGARLYELGMDLLHEGTEMAAGRLVLQEAVATYELVEANEAILNERQRLLFHGMRGVARLVLARQDADPRPPLEAASADLEIAEQLGDRSAAHFVFLAETYQRRYDLVACHGVHRPPVPRAGQTARPGVGCGWLRLATTGAQMRLLAVLPSVVAGVLALVLVARGRPLVERRPTDPRMVRAVGVTILAVSLASLAGSLGAWWLSVPLVVVGVVALVVSLAFAAGFGRR
jgi:hypothetical protein